MKKAFYGAPAIATILIFTSGCMKYQFNQTPASLAQAPVFSSSGPIPEGGTDTGCTDWDNCPNPTPTPRPEGTPPPNSFPGYNECNLVGQQITGGKTLNKVMGVYVNLYQVDVDSNFVVKSMKPVTLPPQSPSKIKSDYLASHYFALPGSSLDDGYYVPILCAAPDSNTVTAPDANCYMKLNISQPQHIATQLSWILDVFEQNPSVGPSANIGSSVLGPVATDLSLKLLPLIQVKSGVGRQINMNSPGLPLLLDGVHKEFIGEDGSWVGDSPLCQNSVESPLIIDTQSAASKARVVLSSPSEGVRFDIAGDGVKHLVSWPVRPDKDMFLALPNKDGQIKSVQELFGNNTLGPDGTRAANGFLALAKYTKHDPKRIVVEDPIYSKLRLWGDLNRNGVVDEGELFTLKDKGITSISLSYKDSLLVDPYGNQSRQRSFVESIGGPRMILDIWFSISQ